MILSAGPYNSRPGALHGGSLRVRRDDGGTGYDAVFCRGGVRHFISTFRCSYVPNPEWFRGETVIKHDCFMLNADKHGENHRRFENVLERFSLSQAFAASGIFWQLRFRFHLFASSSIARTCLPFQWRLECGKHCSITWLNRCRLQRRRVEAV